MIKNYVPLRDAKKVHVVELTHLFGGNKLVTRHYMQDDSAAEILAVYTDEDSSWLSDDFEPVEGTITAGDVTLTVHRNKLANYLVGIEIVDVQ